MPTRIRQVLNTGTITIGSAAQTPAAAKTFIPNEGDIQGFIFEVTAQADGTLVGADVVARALEGITILDKDSNELWSNVPGNKLRQLQLQRTTLGTLATASTITNSNQTNRYEVPWRIDQSRMDCQIELTFAALASLGTSGQTAATASVIVWAVYADDATPAYTEVLDIVDVTAASGNNTFAPYIPSGKDIYNLYFDCATEGDLTNVTFSRDGSVEMNQLSVGLLTAADVAERAGGHITGVFDMRISPFKKTAQAVLQFVMSASEPITLYFVSRTAPVAN